MALSSAAVLAVYAAGYTRTSPAAAAIELEAAARLAAGRDRPERTAMHATPPALATSPEPSVAPTRPESTVAVTQPPTTAASPRKAEPAPPAQDTGTTTAADSGTQTTIPAIPVYTPPPPTPPPVATDSAVATPPPAAPRPLQDGVFHGYGSSRHGDIEVRIEVVGQKIVYAEISRCLTRYSCSWIEKLPAQVIERQSADVDVISGATVSSDAFYMAVREAMANSRIK